MSKRKICVSSIPRKEQWREALRKPPPLALHSLSPTDTKAVGSVKRSNSNQDTDFKVWCLLESFTQLQRSCWGSHGDSKLICISPVCMQHQLQLFVI